MVFGVIIIKAQRRRQKNFQGEQRKKTRPNNSTIKPEPSLPTLMGILYKTYMKTKPIRGG